MASPLELLGINQAGLGPATSGIMALQDQEAQQQRALADLETISRQNRAADLKYDVDALALQEAQALSPSRVTAGIAENQKTAGAAGLEKQQQFGQMVAGVGQMLDRVPVEQRQQYLNQMAERVPGIAENPTFQRLLSTDPSQLPLALREVGQGIMLNTGEQLRAAQLQRQKDEAAMSRAQLAEAGASSRNAADIGSRMQLAQLGHKQAMELEQLRVNAGKYNKKDVMDDPSQAILKYGPEKLSAMALYEASNATTPEEKAYWNSLGEQAAALGSQFRSAGAYPKMGLDPNSPTGFSPQTPYGQQGPAPFAPVQQQPQTNPMQGLPQGTIDNGDGTFTLPDKRKIRRKQ